MPPPPTEPEAAPSTAARPATPGRRRRRRWPWYALAAVLVVVLIVVAAVLYAPRYAEQRLTAALHDMGFTAARLSVDTLGLHRAVVHDLSLGPEVTAREVIATYTPAGIREGRFEGVTVRGLRGRLSADGTGPLFGSLESPLRSLLAAEGGGPPAALPPLTLEDAVIEVATPLGPATLHLAGTVEPEPDAVAAAGLEVQAELPLGRLAGRLEASAGPDGGVSGSLIIQDGALAAAEAGSAGLAGFVQFATSSAGLERLDSDLTLSQPALAGMSFGKGRLRVGFSPETASLSLLLVSGDGRLDLRGTAAVQDPYEAGTLSAIVEATAGPGAPVWSMANLPEPTAGRLRLTATLSADLPGGAAFRPAALIDALQADQGLGASLQFDLEGMAWPGLGRDVSVAGGLDLSHGPGGIVASVPAEILGEITPAPELLDALGLQDRARESFSGRINFSLGFAQPLLVLTGPDAVTLSGRPLLALMTRDGGELSGDVWGTVVLGRDGKLRQFRIDAGKLSALKIDLDGVRLAAATVEGELAGTPQAFAGTLRLTAQAPGLDVPGVRLADLDLTLACDVSDEDGTLTLRLSGNDSRIQARLLTPKTVAQGRPLRLALRPGRDPFLVMDRGPPGG
ncbi:MAG: hypothetical protein IRY94_18560, partial [Rhodospirillaceae bacterium]|nr:hypothetical protein [Rhodospirillaceae bacterium]